jgi:hypothetical protein
MAYPVTDPSEWVGTPEYDEVREDRQRYIHMLLDIIEEERSESLLQFPYRHSH